MATTPQVTQDDVSKLQALVGGSPAPAPQSSAAQAPAAPSGSVSQSDVDKLRALVEGGSTTAGAQNTPAQSQPEGDYLSKAEDFISKGADAATDVATGAVKGAGQTANTVSKLLNKIPVVGEYLVPSAGINAAEQIEAPTNAAQKSGVVLETIAEFMLGDEALKSLSVAERLGIAQKVVRLAETNPRIAQIVTAGLHSMRGGAVVAGQELAHGSSAGDAAKAGAVAAAAGPVIGAVMEGAGAAKQAVAQAYRNVFSTGEIQPVLQKGIRETLGNVAAENGVAKPAAASIRDTAKDVADSIYAKSKGQYAELDKATGGQFQRFDEQLRNIGQKLREVAGIDDEKEAALIEKKAHIEQAQEAVFAKAKQAGVDPKLVDEARANYKKAQALYDVDAQIKQATSGMRPELSNGQSSRELVDPKKAFTRLNKLYDSGRLQEAVGQQNAQQLLEHADNAHLQQQKIINRQQIAKTVGKVAGVSGGGLGVVKIAKDALGQ